MTDIRGKAVLEGHCQPAACSAAGGYRLPSAPALWSQRLAWSSPSAFDIKIIFTLRGAVIASAVVGFPLLVRSIRIGLEGIEQPISPSLADPRGKMVGHAVYHYHPAVQPRHPGRDNPDVCQEPGRIRCHHRAGRQYARSDPDHPLGNLSIYQHSGRGQHGAVPLPSVDFSLFYCSADR